MKIIEENKQDIKNITTLVGGCALLLFIVGSLVPIFHPEVLIENNIEYPEYVLGLGVWLTLGIVCLWKEFRNWLLVKIMWVIRKT